LSTGGIIAIIIPTVVALIAVAIIAMMCANKNAPIQHSQFASTNSNIELKV
jgi:flagellar basal body-associated protein FliL